MFSILIVCSVLWAYGVLSILFAFREVPPALHFFFPTKVPLLLGVVLLFLPEQHQLKGARIGLGAIFFLAALAIGARTLLG